VEYRVVTNGRTFKVQKREIPIGGAYPVDLWCDTKFESYAERLALEERDVLNRPWTVVDE